MIHDLWFWGTIIFAIMFLSMLLFHFKNPLPIIQIPELPHHLYFMTPQIRRVLIEILSAAGHPAYGRFVQGADQVLLQNGTTVLAIREPGFPPTALVIPVQGGQSKLADVMRQARQKLESLGLNVTPIPVDGTDGLITRFRIGGDLGFEIAFRPPGRAMAKALGFPKFTRIR